VGVRSLIPGCPKTAVRLLLPSAPSLISGTDVLRNKRVVQTGGRTAYWTKDILFLGADEGDGYRMLRSGDLSDLGSSG
jgi:hypothetical protein